MAGCNHRRPMPQPKKSRAPRLLMHPVRRQHAIVAQAKPVQIALPAAQSVPASPGAQILARRYR
jgi:hypothetical protein